MQSKAIIPTPGWFFLNCTNVLVISASPDGGRGKRGDFQPRREKGRRRAHKKMGRDVRRHPIEVDRVIASRLYLFDFPCRRI